MNNYVTLLGLIAGVLTTVAFVPQVLKTWTTRSTKDISLGMFLTFCVGVFLWVVYGFLINSLPMILANSITLLLALIIVYFKLRF